MMSQSKRSNYVTVINLIESRVSFEALDNWIQNAKGNCSESAVYVLMGNQADRPAEYKK